MVDRLMLPSEAPVAFQEDAIQRAEYGGCALCAYLSSGIAILVHGWDFAQALLISAL